MVPPQSSHINFINTLYQTPENNIFVYKGFYKGRGVAIGDINNDELLDIYFMENQVSDKLYLNKGNLKFENITVTSGVLDKCG